MPGGPEDSQWCPRVGTRHPAGVDGAASPLETGSHCKVQCPVPVATHLTDPRGPPTSAGGQGEVPRGTVVGASVAGEHSVALQEEAGVAAVADLVAQVEG